MTENHLEDACLEWLAAHGYDCLHGDDVSLGGAQEARAKFSEVVLTPRLRPAVARLNPSLSAAEVDDAVSRLATYSNQSVIDGNKELHAWIRDGVPITRIGADDTPATLRAQVIDFVGTNDFLAVRQLTVQGQKIRRPDIVIFVNGLPLVVVELKNPANLNADIESAYNQIQTYNCLLYTSDAADE
mgnify:CR=1 FL=1